MSTHINARRGHIASTVLLPGDPRRAKYIAKNFLTNAVRYNTVRNMWGYTGTHKGKPVSVHGAGIGMPSLSIIVNELVNDYGAKKLIRVGTTGTFQPDINLRNVIIAAGACSDSNMQTRRVRGIHFAPLADFSLLQKAHEIAERLKISVRVGNIFATDNFYDLEKEEIWKILAKYNVLAAEMESAELYMLAAFYKVQALTLLTVSDSLVTGERLSPKEREETVGDMVRIALEL